MPYRTRRTGRSYRSSKLKREVYWVRGGFNVPASSQNFSINLAGSSLNDPAVKAQRHAGIPDLQAYDATVALTEGTTHKVTYLHFVVELPLTTQLIAGIIKNQIPSQAGTDFPIPNPSTHANQSDWLFWDTWSLGQSGYAALDPPAGAEMMAGFKAVAKSQRRTSESYESFFLSCHLSAPMAATGQAIQVHWASLFAAPLLTR